MRAAVLMGRGQGIGVAGSRAHWRLSWSGLDEPGNVGERDGRGPVDRLGRLASLLGRSEPEVPLIATPLAHAAVREERLVEHQQAWAVEHPGVLPRHQEAERAYAQALERYQAAEQTYQQLQSRGLVADIPTPVQADRRRWLRPEDTLLRSSNVPPASATAGSTAAATGHRLSADQAARKRGWYWSTRPRAAPQNA